MQQTWSYDWIGNTDTSTDDASLFYDRSLGAITNTGYRLTSAPGSGGNHLTAEYDAAGYMTSMTVLRDGTCVPAALCATQTFQYRWDEVGRLVDATRQDASGPGAHLEYAYDASDNRVRKTVVSGEDSRHTIYVFGSLELRLAEFTGTEYAVDDSTEVPYLFGHGVRLARVTYTDAADFQTERRRIFLELGDHLGSTSVVLDHATGELVERSTAFAYGAAESNYRTQRWDHFREDYRFTAKEDDIEVGLIYFGARYLNPQLGRWISADPLAVHAPGKADLNLYAYVHGKVLSAVDPVGLECEGTGGGCGQADGQQLKEASDTEKFKEGENASGDKYGTPKGVLESAAAAAYNFTNSIGNEVKDLWAVLSHDVEYTPGSEGGEYSGWREHKEAQAEASPPAREPEPWDKGGTEAYSYASQGLRVGALYYTLAGSTGKMGIYANAEKAARTNLIPEGASPGSVGRAGEQAVRATAEIGPKVEIRVNGRSRVPDGLTTTTVNEVKNTANQSFTRQLRDYADYANQTGRDFQLWVRPTTRLSGPLQQAVADGTIRLMPIPTQF